MGRGEAELKEEISMSKNYYCFFLTVSEGKQIYIINQNVKIYLKILLSFKKSWNGKDFYFIRWIVEPWRRKNDHEAVGGRCQHVLKCQGVLDGFVVLSYWLWLSRFNFLCPLGFSSNCRDIRCSKTVEFRTHFIYKNSQAYIFLSHFGGPDSVCLATILFFGVFYPSPQLPC